jgi:hypothetical protein
MLVSWEGWRAIYAGRANGRVGFNRMDWREGFKGPSWQEQSLQIEN